MKFDITIPQSSKTCTIKELLEEEWLIPRKIRHFLRVKKHLFVNGKSVHWQEKINSGDLVTLYFDEEDYPQKNIPFGNKQIVDAVYEDEHIIVVNKPEKMKTHANQPNELALLNHVSAYVGRTCYVVHRLDKETSGLILFAKNPFVLPILNQLLAQRKIHRQYLALCQGHFHKNTITITDKIGRDRHDKRKRIVTQSGGQSAKTKVQILQSFKNRTLVSCQLDTGRTHQIRVHLSHHQHPIIGDPLYSKTQASRLMLHAEKLTFIHPFTRKTIPLQAASQSFKNELTKKTSS